VIGSYLSVGQVVMPPAPTWRWGWLTTFITSWYTHGIARYLEGCNFLTVAVSTPADSGTLIAILWGPEAVELDALVPVRWVVGICSLTRSCLRLHATAI